MKKSLRTILLISLIMILILNSCVFVFATNSYVNDTRSLKNSYEASNLKATVENAPTIKTTLEDGKIVKGSKMTFDLWATDAKGDKIDGSSCKVTLNGKEVRKNWEDSYKTSYTLEFVKDSNEIVITATDEDNQKTAIKEYTITYVPQIDGIIGEVVVDIELFSLGGEYLIAPTKVEIKEGENAAKILDRVLKENGFTYKKTGSLDSSFYLASINGGDVENTDIVPMNLDNAPSYIQTALNENGFEKENDEWDRTDEDSLGEFDYTHGSGWMYCVNNVFPNVGFADCYLQDGDVMRIQFTLAYGADIGGSSAMGGGGFGTNFYEVENKDELIRTIAEKGIENVSADILNRAKILDPRITTGEDKPDFYKFSMESEDGTSVDIYISDIAGSAGESSDKINAFAKRSDEVFWNEYVLNGDSWKQSSLYAYDPVLGNGTVVGRANQVASTSSKKIPIIKEMTGSINAKRNALLQILYDKIGVNPANLTQKDKDNIMYGLNFSIDDNLYFGLANKILKNTPAEDNYYFMKAKSFGDSVFVAAYTTGAVGSAAEAARALNAAGVSGSMAIATSETGVGGAAFGAAALGELAEAGVMAGISYVSGKMATRSQNILTADVEKLKQTIGYKIRVDIQHRLRDISYTGKTEKTAAEMNKFWTSKPTYKNPPYKSNTPVYEFKLKKEENFVRLYDEKGSQITGQWVMKLEDITNIDGSYLTAAQLRDKFALPDLPKYVADAKIEAGSTMHCGIAGPIEGWGKGGGIQFDLNNVKAGKFTYRATLSN